MTRSKPVEEAPEATTKKVVAGDYRPVPKGPWKAAAVGSGSWGNTVALLMASNVASLKDWHNEVRMQIYDELIITEQDMYGLQQAAKNGSAAISASNLGSKLSEIINTKHINVKYLPNVDLPKNLVAVPEMDDAIDDADVVVLGVPDQFIVPTCKRMKQVIKPTARVIVLAKGVEFHDHKLVPMSDVVAEKLDIPVQQVCVLMGANIAAEVAKGYFSESTLACKHHDDLVWLKPIFSRPFFPIGMVDNVEGPQMCGALKNVVALGKGLLDGQGASSNTVAALMRVGMNEMRGLIKEFFDVPEGVFWESFCFADLITTCNSGRNRLVAMTFAQRNGKDSFERIEAELLNGQRLQGTITAIPIHEMIVLNDWTKRFPLFEAVYQVVAGNKGHTHVIEALEMTPQTNVADLEAAAEN